MKTSLTTLKEKLAKRCERCMEDGLESDEDCPWYGEPNGCNSPNYGEDPRIQVIDEIKKHQMKPETEYAIKDGNTILDIFKSFDYAKAELKRMEEADAAYDIPDRPNRKIVARVVYRTPWIKMPTEI